MQRRPWDLLSNLQGSIQMPSQWSLGKCSLGVSRWVRGEVGTRNRIPSTEEPPTPRPWLVALPLVHQTTSKARVHKCKKQSLLTTAKSYCQDSWCSGLRSHSLLLPRHSWPEPWNSEVIATDLGSPPIQRNPPPFHRTPLALSTKLCFQAQAFV